MLPSPDHGLALAPVRRERSRALTTIYAPRAHRRTRKRRATMLDSEPIKPSLSPFHPLPAIGKKLSAETKVIVFDLNKNETRPATVEERPLLKVHLLEPLHIKKKQQHLIRENTYDVINPICLASNLKKRDTVVPRRSVSDTEGKSKMSARSRFKKAALDVAKLSSVPETGKLLCLRERAVVRLPGDEQQTCRFQHLPESPAHKLDRLSEIFQGLEINGRHRDKMKKENSWF